MIVKCANIPTYWNPSMIWNVITQLISSALRRPPRGNGLMESLGESLAL